MQRGASAPSNWRFNADANTGHGFAILLASVGTYALRDPAPVNLGYKGIPAKSKNLSGWIPLKPA